MIYNHCICAIFYTSNVYCSENQLANLCKCKLKCACLKALFNRIYLPGQAAKYFDMSVPVYAHLQATTSSKGRFGVYETIYLKQIGQKGGFQFLFNKMHKFHYHYDVENICENILLLCHYLIHKLALY